MKIRYFREFIVLSQTLNFTKAADILYIAQSVLSKHTAILEEEVGTSLLFRTKHTVKLTETGEFFLKEIKNVLAQYDETIEKIRLTNAGFVGNLGIGMFSYSKEIIVPAIELFKKDFPNIKLDFLSGTPNEVVNAVFDDSVDLGVIMHVDFQNSHRLNFFDLYKEPLVVMVNHKHPLAGRNSILISELKDENFVNVNDNFFHGYFEYIRKLCVNHGFEPKDPILVDNYEMLLLTIESECGIAILTSIMKKERNPNSSFVDIENKDFFIVRSIVYKSDNTNPAIPLFLERVKQDNQPS